MGLLISDTYYPPPGFRFALAVVGTGTALFLATSIDASFKEISGIEARFDVEEVVEGGENRYVHRLPKGGRHPNLSLKRGYVTQASFLAEWVGFTVGSSMTIPIITQTLVVMLLDQSNIPSMAWSFSNAWPIRWAVGNFNAMESQIFTETLEFSYSYVTRFSIGAVTAMAASVAALVS
jgi:phage tail-like protein